MVPRSRHARLRARFKDRRTRSGGGMFSSIAISMSYRERARASFLATATTIFGLMHRIRLAWHHPCRNEQQWNKKTNRPGA